MNVVRRQTKIVGFDSISLQGPAITHQPAFGLDQPQDRPSCKTFSDISPGQLRIPETGDVFQVTGAEFAFVPLPFHFERPAHTGYWQALGVEIAIKKDHARRK